MKAPAVKQRPGHDSPTLTMPMAVVSVGLGMYLIGLVLAMAGNTMSGSSLLVRAIKGRLFVPWMRPTWLDLGFDHSFTYGLPEDARHSLEIRAQAGESVTMAYPGKRKGEQAARWRRFARTIAFSSIDGTAASLMAGAATGTFREFGTEDVVVRVLRPVLPEPRSRSTDLPFTEPGAARVRRVAGEVQVIELGGPEKRQELAPVLREPAAKPPVGAPAGGGETDD